MKSAPVILSLWILVASVAFSLKNVPRQNHNQLADEFHQLQAQKRKQQTTIWDYWGRPQYDQDDMNLKPSEIASYQEELGNDRRNEGWYRWGERKLMKGANTLTRNAGYGTAYHAIDDLEFYTAQDAKNKHLKKTKSKASKTPRKWQQNPKTGEWYHVDPTPGDQ